MFFFGDNDDFLLRSSNMLDYVNGFLNVEPSLHSWNMSHNVFFFNVVDLFSLCYIKIFLLIFVSEISLCFLCYIYLV